VDAEPVPRMAKASVGGEATARSTRSVRRGTEDGTKGIDQQSKLGTLWRPAQSRPSGAGLSQIIHKAAGGGQRRR